MVLVWNGIPRAICDKPIEDPMGLRRLVQQLRATLQAVASDVSRSADMLTMLRAGQGP